MSKICTTCNSSFEVTELDIKYLEKISPVINQTKYRFDDPKLCPSCRQQRRAAFRNDKNYYKNKCSMCGTSIISIYSPEKKFPVLCTDCFWSDKFDPSSYSRNFDFSKTFFEQFADFKLTVPRLAIFNTLSENCLYTVHSAKNRNCYLCSSTRDTKDSHYCDHLVGGQDCFDIYSCKNLELCYECSQSEDCYNSDYLKLCYNLHDSYLCFDCRGSFNLVGCVGLRRQENYILNKRATKQECIDTIFRINTDQQFRNDFYEKFQKIKQKYPRPCHWIFNSEDCTGNYLSNCAEVTNCFNAKGAGDGRYGYETINIMDFLDVTRTGNSELVYETTGCAFLNSCAFCSLTYFSSNVMYADNCANNARNCFAGVSLKGNQYCIFNKQYTEKEYNKLLVKLISHMKETGEWGEFFPISLSSFAYNETKAMEWFPLTKEEAQAKKISWSDYTQPLPSGIKIIKPEFIPYKISDVTNDIIKTAFECEVTKRPFRILAQDLRYHRTKNLPLPKRSPKQRHLDRISSLHKHHTYQAFCDKCGLQVDTSYPPTEQVIIYCDDCYSKNVN